MKRCSIGLFVVLFSGLGVLYAWARLRSEMRGTGDAGLVIIEGPQKHLVTPEMLEATGKMTKQVAPAFQAEATNGKTYRLEFCKVRSTPVEPRHAHRASPIE
jgi:hypothetical protein